MIHPSLPGRTYVIEWRNTIACVIIEYRRARAKIEISPKHSIQDEAVDEPFSRNK